MEKEVWIQLILIADFHVPVSETLSSQLQLPRPRHLKTRTAPGPCVLLVRALAGISRQGSLEVKGLGSESTSSSLR